MRGELEVAMNEIYLCRSCSRSTPTPMSVCGICGACSWNIVTKQLRDMPWYPFAAKLRIMARMMRAQAADPRLAKPSRAQSGKATLR
jgi:hypothetical protein